MINAVASSSSARFSSAPLEKASRRSAPSGADGINTAAQQRTSADTGETAASEDSKKKTTVGGKRELTDEERQEVAELKRVDSHVRQHEAAHQAAAGSLARGKSFTYKQGPDGNQYAVAGEVQIDTSAVPNNPQATIARMQRVRAAASAPSDPSSQDRSVAAQASRTEAEARAELLKPEEEEQQAIGVAGRVIPSEATDKDTSEATEEDTEKSAEGSIDSPTRQQINPYSATNSPGQSSYKERGTFINTYA